MIQGTSCDDSSFRPSWWLLLSATLVDGSLDLLYCSLTPCRLVTDITLQRKRRRVSLKKRQLEKVKAEGAEYHKLLVQRLKEQRERRCGAQGRVAGGAGCVFCLLSLMRPG